MNKEIYEKAEVEVIAFSDEDVILTSSCGSACTTEVDEDVL